eukprot:EG_transcript_46289
MVNGGRWNMFDFSRIDALVLGEWLSPGAAYQCQLRACLSALFLFGPFPLSTFPFQCNCDLNASLLHQVLVAGQGCSTEHKLQPLLNFVVQEMRRSPCHLKTA